jgi:hypothetical protein
MRCELFLLGKKGTDGIIPNLLCERKGFLRLSDGRGGRTSSLSWLEGALQLALERIHEFRRSEWAAGVGAATDRGEIAGGLAFGQVTPPLGGTPVRSPAVQLQR